MCFSATASFAASAVLSGIGIVALSRAHTIPWKLFASIPVLFAAQQAAEGYIWYSTPGSTAQQYATYLFLSFALIVWPLLLPFSVYLLEQNKKRRTLLLLCCSAGVLFATAALYTLLFSGPVYAQVTDHIFYAIGMHMPTITSTLLYLVATVVPFFLSTRTYMGWFGALIALSYAVTVYRYTHFFVSVWCFFAALISAGVIVIIERNKSSY